MKTGIELIAQERSEQLGKHNRSVEGDVQQNYDEQLRFAVQALLVEGEHGQYHEDDISLLPDGWDEAIFRKMLLKPYRERLVIAGALIAAEIDRIQSPQR